MLPSCEFEQDQEGFPSSVVFPPEGGEKIVSGDREIREYALSFDDINDDRVGNTEVGENDTLILKSDWLLVKYVPFETKMKIIAAPSENGKKRQLTIYNGNGTKFSETKVIQF